MRVSQRVYFAVHSEHMAPKLIEARLGIQGDVVRTKGAKRASPPVPITNSVQFHEHSASAPLTERLEQLIRRLEPCASRIKALVAAGEGSAVLQVVREFDGLDGEEECHADLQLGDVTLVVVPGQHQLLGFHLSSEILSFLTAAGASVDFDEYG